MTNLLEVKNLWAGYLNKTIISAIDFSVKKGEFIGIIGPNGVGKSTLIRAVSRTLKPYRGAIIYNGKNIYKISLNEVARSIAVVPQDTLIVFEFLVWDIVMMGRIPYIERFKKETAGDLESCERALKLTNTTNLADRFINELSAGERQRVIIAKALAQEPELLILDEPTSHLDISHQIEIFDLLKHLSRNENLTVLSVLHDLNLASEYCDRLILMNEGKIFAQGVPDDVLNYKTIEEVYKTMVVIGKNPISKRPYIFLVPKERK
ncbi:MAG: ABC transporter ATP-binding protein [Candidatus Omnitrophica bacterium]|nr:ABC transporter ATP-binding protein [Candidatus Omnitrophota bacterium]